MLSELITKVSILKDFQPQVNNDVLPGDHVKFVRQHSILLLFCFLLCLPLSLNMNCF